MKTVAKIAVIALIVIIVSSIGAYAYLNMPKQENTQPNPTSYTVTIQSSPNGTTTPTSGTYNYTSGNSVTFTATPNTGYKFDYWTINEEVDTTNPKTKTITSDLTINPVFTLENQPAPVTYSVNMQSSPNGTTTPSAGTHNYTSGSSATFTATPNSGYIFDHWLVDGTAKTTNPLILAVTSDTTISPIFIVQPPTSLTLTVSSTTSLYETGVENDAIKPAFQAKYPWITLNFLSQGTGAAIQTAMRGDADMIMVHDPGQENTFMVNGYGVNRKIIAYNFFIIVGPKSDPAGVSGMTPIAAMQRIYNLGQSGQAMWVSRGDGSGTNSKEKSLWAAAGINWTQIRTQTSWYKETGQGMTSTLVVANYLNGYTIADTASYLTNTKAKNIDMKIVVEAQKDLLNVYSVIVDNPLNANLTTTHFDASMLFVQFMVSDEGQQLLANFGTATFGQALFSPFVPLASNVQPNATLLSWIQNYAYLPANTTECPAAYRYNAGSLYLPSYDALGSASPTTIKPVPYLIPRGKTLPMPNLETNVWVQPLLAIYAAIFILDSKIVAKGKNRLWNVKAYL